MTHERELTDTEKHEHYQRVGVDDDQPPGNTETRSEDLGQDPRDTEHPAGDEHAQRNIDNEPPG